VNGLRALKPLLPRKTKSVLTSCLEREPIVIPKDHWDATDPLICIEVVFGTGDIFRTGSAAGPGTVAEQLAGGIKQINPMGPLATDFSRVVQGSQGTMGIVAWATVVCGLLPSIQKTFFIVSENPEPLIELTYRLTRDRIGEELFMTNGLRMANIAADRTDEVDKLASTMPPWILVLSLTGHEYYPEEKIAYQEKDVRRLAQGLGLELRTSVAGFGGNALIRKLENPPEDYYKTRYKGGCQDIFFITTLDKTPGFMEVIDGVLGAQRYRPAELGIYIQPMIQGCACHCEFSLVNDPSDEREGKGVKETVIAASKHLADSGAFFSRPYGPWADIAYRKDAETTAALRKVKGIFDPNKIMNPGRLCY
jgi:FAD/FMN-containing dehydrogenase